MKGKLILKKRLFMQCKNGYSTLIIRISNNRKIALVHQEKQAKEAATQDEKTSRNNQQRKSIIVTENGKLCY